MVIIENILYICGFEHKPYIVDDEFSNESLRSINARILLEILPVNNIKILLNDIEQLITINSNFRILYSTTFG